MNFQFMLDKCGAIDFSLLICYFLCTHLQVLKEYNVVAYPTPLVAWLQLLASDGQAAIYPSSSIQAHVVEPHLKTHPL